jgi:hypothetical protein
MASVPSAASASSGSGLVRMAASVMSVGSRADVPAYEIMLTLSSTIVRRLSNFPQRNIFHRGNSLFSGFLNRNC